MDRISELPEEVIHHILSFLSTKAAAKTSTLSKKWLHSWSTYPISDFRDFFFGKKLEESQKFIKFVDRALQRYREQNMHMKKFRLHLEKFYARKFVSQIDNWIETAVENQVEELDLFIKDHHTLPQKIFAAKSLVVLALKNCKLMKELDTNTINFHSLKKLSLKCVYLDDSMIQSLISSCPLIEEINLSNCRGLYKIQVANFSRLKSLEIIFSHYELESVHIDAPSLEFLHMELYSDIPWNTKVGSCGNLKHLHLQSANIGDDSLRDFVSHFPLLEFLKLKSCNMLERINISSDSLREFSLVNFVKIVEAKIDAPNLVLFDYEGNFHPHLQSTSDLVVCEAYLWFNQHVDALSFNKLGKFLTKSGQFKQVNLIFPTECIFDVEEWKEIPNSLIYEVESLELSISPFSSPLSYLDLLKGLFCICHPKTLYLKLNRYPSKNLIKEVIQMFMTREDQYCCSSSHIKCWRHRLNDVQIEYLVGEIREYEGSQGTQYVETIQWKEFRLRL